MTTATEDIFRNLYSLRRRVEAFGGEYGDEAAQMTAAVVRDIQRDHPAIGRAVSRCFEMRRAPLASAGTNLSRWFLRRGEKPSRSNQLS